MRSSEPFLSTSWYRVASLKPRLREHLTVRIHRYRHQIWYVITDGIGNRVHRLSPAGYVLAAAMDGSQTVDRIWTDAARKLGEQAPTQGQVIALMGQLHANDLLAGDLAPDASELFERKARLDRSKLLQWLLNPLAIRIPLFDPHGFLSRTLPIVRPLFGWTGAMLWLLIVLPAEILAARNWPELTENIGDRVLLPDNLLLMAAIYPAIKLLHELAHGFATRIKGGEVHELGLMLLVLLPIPYIEVSAAAGFRGKWSRCLVGLAGILTELFIAALACDVWVLVEPGFVRATAFNVMLTAGISSLFFNGNPLLRYDGYYVLADLIEVPNLALRGGQYWSYLIRRYVFGLEQVNDFPATAGERLWFMVYTPASAVYRVMVSIGIALLLMSKYLAAGVLLAWWGLATGLVLPVLRGVWSVFASPAYTGRRLRPAAVTLGSTVTMVWLFLCLPAPSHTNAEGVVWLPDSAFVRAGTDGFVGTIAAVPGTEIATGQVLVTLYDPEIVTRAAFLHARESELTAKLESVRFADRVEALVTTTELEAIRADRIREDRRAELLQARSQNDGIFLMPEPADAPGRFFRRGQILGYVLPTDGARSIRATIAQENIDLVRHHLRQVRVKLIDRLDGELEVTNMHEIPAAKDQLPSAALGTTGGGATPVDPRDEHGRTALNRMFQVDLDLREAVRRAGFGSRALVRFEHDWEPLGGQLWRRLRQLLLSRTEV